MKLKEILEGDLFCDGDWVESKDQDPTGEVRLIQLADIGDGEFIDKSNRFMNKPTANKLRCTYLEKGDILVARMPDPLGRACIFPFEKKEKYVTVVDVAILRPNGKCDNRYLQHALNSPFIRHEIFRQSTGTTRKRITRKKLGELDIPLPPLKNQQKIAAILDEADRLRQLDKQLIQKYEELSQSLFLEMFGDPLSNPKGWKYQTVNDFATIVRGSSPRPKGDPRYYGKGVPRLMVADLTRDGLYVTPQIDSLTIEGAKKSRPMKKGELVMAVSGRPGLPAILEVDCCIHDGFAGFRNVSNEYNKVFLYFYFWKYINEVNKRSVGAIFKNITTNDIREIKVPIVPLELQSKFSRIVEDLSKQKSLAMENALITDGLFNSLLQKAFKGELV